MRKWLLWTVLAALLSGCLDNAEFTARAEMWNHAKLVRICVDGSKIYLLPNGEYWEGSFPGRNRVDGPHVCG